MHSLETLRMDAGLQRNDIARQRRTALPLPLLRRRHCAQTDSRVSDDPASSRILPKGTRTAAGRAVQVGASRSQCGFICMLSYPCVPRAFSQAFIYKPLATIPTSSSTVSNYPYLKRMMSLDHLSDLPDEGLLFRSCQKVFYELRRSLSTA